jgi:hypothetical protein
MVGAGQKPHLASVITHFESLHPCLTERPCFIRKRNRASETREGQMAWGIKVLMIMMRYVSPSEPAFLLGKLGRE